MINRLVIFGATGDLNARYLLPALAALRAAGHLDDRFELTCVDRADWTGEEFQRWAAEQLDRHDVSSPAEARQAITKPTRYLRAEATDVADVASAIAGDEPVAVYLSPSPQRSSPVRSPRCGTRAWWRAAESCWRSRSVRIWTVPWR
ncbi:hypothetical protein [Nonomuraea sp. NPDC050202]|uniref:hypothetical protein n=1 Tax=Nonomuraea sp. NPDC050202 TaxID=3155035 RepID=UPI0033F7FA95